MQHEIIRRLAMMTTEERQKLKRKVLALFRRAELRAVKGKLDDGTHRSLRNSGERAIIKVVKTAIAMLLEIACVSP